MSKLYFVRQFIKMGISVIPIFHRNKIPDVSIIGGTWEQYSIHNNTEYEVERWFSSDWLNYGVVAGWGNLVVIDFDSMFYFDLWREWMSGTQYVLDGFQVRTRKGMHVYLTTETPCANDKRISKSAGIDVQAQGKYVVGPGCVHPSGHVYEAVGDFVFPLVRDIETILPLDLFPRVTHEPAVYTGAPVSFSNHTEYLSDPLTDSRDLISKVKASVRIETLFTGVQRSSTDGRWLKALCPFHKDKHQSAWIDTARQLCGCQVCRMKPMDALNVYARMHNISDRDAVMALAQEVRVWR